MTTLTPTDGPLKLTSAGANTGRATQAPGVHTQREPHNTQRP